MLKTKKKRARERDVAGDVAANDEKKPNATASSTSAEPPPAPPIDVRPKRKKTSAPSSARPARRGTLTAFGMIPDGAIAWGLYRKTPGGGEIGERLSADNGEGLLVEWFPLELLSVGTILSQWGEGTYRTCWLGPSPKGGRSRLGWGEWVGVRAAPQAAPAPVVTAPAAPVPDWMQMLATINGMASQQTTQLVQLATAFGGQQRAASSGVDPTVQLMMQQMQRQNAMIARVLERLAPADVDDDAGDEDEDDDGEEEDHPVAAANPGGGPFVPGGDVGEQMKAAMLNMGFSALQDILKNNGPAVLESIVAALMKKNANGAQLPSAPAVVTLPLEPTPATSSG